MVVLVVEVQRQALVAAVVEVLMVEQELKTITLSNKAMEIMVVLEKLRQKLEIEVLAADAVLGVLVEVM